MTPVPSADDAVQEVLDSSDAVLRRLDEMTGDRSLDDLKARQEVIANLLNAAIEAKDESEIRRLTDEGKSMLKAELEALERMHLEAQAEFEKALDEHQTDAESSPEVQQASARVQAWADRVYAMRKYMKTYRWDEFYDADEILKNLRDTDSAVSGTSEPLPVEAVVRVAEQTVPVGQQPESLAERMAQLRALRDAYVAELEEMKKKLKIKELEASISA